MEIAGEKQTTFQTETLKNTSSFPCVFPREVATLVSQKIIQYVNVFFCLIAYFPGNVFMRTAQK
jgi:hypothetical protein